MKKIGILSAPTKSKPWYDIILNKVVVKEQFGRYVVAEVAVSHTFFRRMIGFQRKIIVNKAKRFLKKLEITDFVLDEKIADCVQNSSKHNYSIPKNKIFDCFIFAKSKIDAKIKNVVVVDKQLKADYNELYKIFGVVGIITLCTDEIWEARNLADRMMYDYGVCINVVSEKHGVIYAVINVDEGYVRVGDFIIDGVEFLNDSREYGVDMSIVAGFIDEDNNLEIKNWISGKNIMKNELTI